MQLLLVPTVVELRHLKPHLDGWSDEARVEVCGFGPIAAAARASQLIAQFRPDHVWLLGIAGSYPDGPPVGEATSFEQVACYGVGVGDGSDFTSAESMGWLQWPHEARLESDVKSAPIEESTAIGDVINLSQHMAPQGALDVNYLQGCLVTVCAASQSAADAQQRISKIPNAVAEDMEGFGVALACELANTPLTIVRGMSNLAGDRDKNHWKIPDALESAANLLRKLAPRESKP